MHCKSLWIKASDKCNNLFYECVICMFSFDLISTQPVFFFFFASCGFNVLATHCNISQNLKCKEGPTLGQLPQHMIRIYPTTLILPIYMPKSICAYQYHEFSCLLAYYIHTFMRSGWIFIIVVVWTYLFDYFNL